MSKEHNHKPGDKVAFVATIAWFIGACILFLLVRAYTQTNITDDDRVELNFLNSTLRDFEVLDRQADTPAAQRLREIECEDFPKKAKRYLRIPTAGSIKVEQYVAYCRKAAP